MKKLILMLLVLMIILFSCNFPGPDNLFGLEGEWLVTSYPSDSVADFSNHKTLIFSLTGYEIKGADGAVFESGTISNAAETGYDYIMERYDPAPEYEGGKNCAEFSIDNQVLTITFFSADKSDNYGTLKAERKN